VPLLLQMGKETAEHVGRDLLDGHVDGVRGVLVGKIPEEQAEGVSIAFLGIHAEVAVRDDILEQEATDKGPKRMGRIHVRTSVAIAA
jgi:hypothetical protein